MYLVFGFKFSNLKTIGMDDGTYFWHFTISPDEEVSTQLIFPASLNYTKTLAVQSVTFPITGPTLMPFVSVI